MCELRVSCLAGVRGVALTRPPFVAGTRVACNKA